MSTHRRAARLEVLTYNTHVGRALAGLRWLLTKPGLRRTHVVCLQEVQTRRAKLAVRLILLPGVWITAGPPLNSPAGTIVYVRRSRFRKVANYHHRITAGPPQGALPARWLDGGVFVDKVTGRYLDATSVHPWALGQGLAHADAHAAGEHVDQVDAVAAHHETAVLERPGGATLRVDDTEVLRVAAGDWNEDLGAVGHVGPQDRPTARLTMRSAGMVPAATITRAGDAAVTLADRIDETFVRPRPWLTVLDRRLVHVPQHVDTQAEPQHPGVWVALHVEPLAA